ncbi:hypothetical protein [Microbulbifer hydrolyticus]|uniref:Uncharacterized protein n=1 Tax=Microbulbifer hydrolyticus TaxID=48074 RepID=A0A6P1T7N2_9GAMM|nr:hypothetical protein [Microbulbifer hydrolyticus]MBB5211593.1 hypothetical protein [Microbulbifer hydrolyticus]QHQ37670.1 hypothetical protein GTQ55_00845 [Microbulbifer hydrolyticus]
MANGFGADTTMGQRQLICDDVLTIEADALVCRAYKHLICGRRLKPLMAARQDFAQLTVCLHDPGAFAIGRKFREHFPENADR